MRRERKPRRRSVRLTLAMRDANQFNASATRRTLQRNHLFESWAIDVEDRFTVGAPLHVFRNFAPQPRVRDRIP